MRGRPPRHSVRPSTTKEANDGRIRHAAGGHRRDRWRTGGARDRLPPAEAGTTVRDPGRRCTRRRLVAEALGLAPALHARAVRVAAGRPLPRDGLALPDQGRDGRPPRVLRDAVLVAGPERRVRGPAVARGRPVHGVGGRAAVRGRQRRRGDGREPPAARRRSSRTSSIPKIVQLHSAAYRHPSQLREGDVLVVGAGNSGADISIEVAREHRTWLAGLRGRARAVPASRPGSRGTS